MLHSEYLENLKTYLNTNSEHLPIPLSKKVDKFIIITQLNFDPTIERLDDLYSPIQRAPRRDPTCMLRSLILMTLLKIRGITEWVEVMRSNPLYAILAGFQPETIDTINNPHGHNTPGVGTYYDFKKRTINGPYGSDNNNTENFIPKKKRCLKEPREDSINPNQSLSQQLIDRELLPNADQPLLDDFNKILNDLLLKLGIIPSIEQGHLNLFDDLFISGDGSILPTQASSKGSKHCPCKSESCTCYDGKSFKCDNPLFYSSPTAQWCHTGHSDRYIFGDRYYHVITTQNGHDFPLLTIMPGGNESDYTLSLKAIDRTLKLLNEYKLCPKVHGFIGDGHHDSYAHYQYFQEKDILPVIPLTKVPEKPAIRLGERGIEVDSKGTPICPAGIPMQNKGFNKIKQAHLYTCPAKRCTHKDNKPVYVFHINECPQKKDCRPGTTVAPVTYIKVITDPRYYPQIPRESKKFKELYNQRSASERVNAVIDNYKIDRSCRNAYYGLFRITLADIAHHATIRFKESIKETSKEKLCVQILKEISVPVPQIIASKVN